MKKLFLLCSIMMIVQITDIFASERKGKRKYSELTTAQTWHTKTRYPRRMDTQLPNSFEKLSLTHSQNSDDIKKLQQQALKEIEQGLH